MLHWSRNDKAFDRKTCEKESCISHVTQVQMCYTFVTHDQNNEKHNLLSSNVGDKIAWKACNKEGNSAVHSCTNWHLVGRTY